MPRKNKAGGGDPMDFAGPDFAGPDFAGQTELQWKNRFLHGRPTFVWLRGCGNSSHRGDFLG